MSWAVGWDPDWHRDIGYGVPALCDQPGCGAEIDRGLAFVCGGQPYGGEEGCGLFFCPAHGGGYDFCTHRPRIDDDDYRPSADVLEWVTHKLNHDSWQNWRDENPTEVQRMREAIGQ